ncbi:hypothetical protein GQ53DRAFT_888654 [Thozetella sp. PMI_491]|nr:hypothetical protein GQ53DRAFT_888654 [Thozetella sp. PMI_491]
MAATIGVGVAFIVLGQVIEAVKQAVFTPPVSTSTKAINVEIGGPIPRFTFYSFDGINLGTNDACQDPSGCDLQLDTGSRTAFRFVEADNHPEYMKITIPDSSNHDVCISYMLISDAVDNHAVSLLYVWNGSIGKACDLPWYESETFLPSPAQDLQPPCVWFSNEGDGSKPMGMSFRLRDMSNPDGDKLLGLAQQYQTFSDTICKAPARLQFWKKTTPDACVPRYNGFPQKTSNGSDSNFSEVQFGHVLDNNCNPGEPFNNADIVLHPIPVQGQDGFGGVGGFVPNPTSEIGQGNFGGAQGFAPIPQQTSTPPPPAAGTPSSPAAPIPTGDDGCGDDPLCDGPPTEQATPTPSPPPRDTPHGGVGVSIVSIQKAQAKRAGPTPAVAAPRIKGRHVTQKHDKCVSHLTVSEHVSHARSATSLCESTTSWGPDFVSVIGRQFCDMCTRRVWDLCDGEKGDECFHLPTRSLRSKHLKRGEVKTYTKVDEWKRK